MWTRDIRIRGVVLYLEELLVENQYRRQGVAEWALNALWSCSEPRIAVLRLSLPLTHFQCEVDRLIFREQSANKILVWPAALASESAFPLYTEGADTYVAERVLEQETTEARSIALFHKVRFFFSPSVAHLPPSFGH